jgi:hypothetical protein
LQVHTYALKIHTITIHGKKDLPPRQNRSEIASIPKSLARRREWGRAAAGMEAVGALPGSICDSTNM